MQSLNTIPRIIAGFYELQGPQKGRTMEYWIKHVFPQGLCELKDALEKQYTEAREVLMRELDLRGTLQDYSIATHDHATATSLESFVGYRNDPEVNAAYENFKRTRRIYNDTCLSEKFFVERLIPRLEQLKSGAKPNHQDLGLIGNAMSDRLHAALPARYKELTPVDYQPPEAMYMKFMNMLAQLHREMLVELYKGTTVRFPQL